jgi:hypothetical protein
MDCPLDLEGQPFDTNLTLILTEPLFIDLAKWRVPSNGFWAISYGEGPFKREQTMTENSETGGNADDAERRQSALVGTKELITDAYKKHYGWNVEVSDPAPAFNGQLYVVRRMPSNDDEICFFSNGRVRIFGSTEDLVDFLSTKADPLPLLERLTGRSVVTSLVFIMLAVGIFVAGFPQFSFDKDVVKILGSVFGVAAGFFFGQSFAKDK